MCCLWCVGIWGKSRVNVSGQKTEDRQEKRLGEFEERMGSRERERETGVREVRLRGGGGGRGKERERYTVRLHLRVTILIEKSLASSSRSPLFSSLASFYTQ